MLVCSTPRLAKRLMNSLTRVQTGSNIHRVSNYRMVVRSIQSLCNHPDDCPGIDECVGHVENQRILSDITNWVVNEWKKKYSGWMSDE